MPNSQSTTTADLGRSGSTSTPRSTDQSNNTDRLRTRRRKSGLPTHMRTPRTLQRNPPTKRTRDTTKTVSPPTKRVQPTRKETPTRPHEDISEDVDRAHNDHTPRSRQARLSPTPPRSDPPVQPVPLVSAHNPAGTRVIGSVRPQPRSSAQSPETGPRMTQESMLEMLKASEQRILKHVISQQRAVLSRIEAVESTLQEVPASISAVKSGIADLKVMLLPGGSKSTSQRTAKRSRNQTKTTVLRDEAFEANPTLPAELEIVFQTDVTCIGAAKAMATQMVKFHRNRDTVSVSSRAMHTFIHSPNTELGKNATNNDGIAFRHGEFRFKIAKFTLELARSLPDQRFWTEGSHGYSEGNQNGNAAMPRKPSWLSPDFVELPSLMLARKHHEWLVSDLPKEPADPQKRKALYIAKRFFKISVDGLRLARGKCRTKMFEDGYFCLLDWESLFWFPKELHNPS